MRDPSVNVCEWKLGCRDVAVMRLIFSKRIFEMPEFDPPYKPLRMEVCETHAAAVRKQYIDVSEIPLVSG